MPGQSVLTITPSNSLGLAENLHIIEIFAQETLITRDQVNLESFRWTQMAA